MIQDIDSGVARRLVSVVPYLIVAFKVVVPSPAPLVRQEIPNVFTSSHFQHSGPTIVQVYVTFESGFLSNSCWWRCTYSSWCGPSCRCKRWVRSFDRWQLVLWFYIVIIKPASYLSTLQRIYLYQKPNIFFTGVSGIDRGFVVTVVDFLQLH